MYTCTYICTCISLSVVYVLVFVTHKPNISSVCKFYCVFHTYIGTSTVNSR